MKPRTKKLNSQFHNLLAVPCGVLLAAFAVICAGQPGFAQQGARPAALANGAASSTTAALQHSASRPLAAQAELEEKEATALSRPGGEGIRIHGHWKFVVHDPDGKLVSTREFENSLLTPSQGDYLLATLLLGNSVAADWGIALCPSAGGTWNADTPPNFYAFCKTTGPTPIAILVQKTNGPFGSLAGCGSSCVPGLQTQLTGSPNLLNPIGISLTGSYAASQNVSINAVETATAFCTTDQNASNPANPGISNLSPTTCLTLSSSNVTPPNSNSSLSFTEFTGTGLAAPQVLTAGQILTVTVTLSFS